MGNFQSMSGPSHCQTWIDNCQPFYLHIFAPLFQLMVVKPSPFSLYMKYWCYYCDWITKREGSISPPSLIDGCDIGLEGSLDIVLVIENQVSVLSKF